MRFVRFDSPEVARSIASTRAVARWGWSALVLVCIASVLGLLIAFVVNLIASARTAVWFGVPVVLALNGLILWRGRSARLNWVLAACADRVYVRLFVRRGSGLGNLNEPDVLIFEAPEIRSMSAQTVEVLLDGSKSRVVEHLVIKPVQTITEDISSDIDSLRCTTGLLATGKQTFVASYEGRLIIEWKWCRPALQAFLRQVVQECPSISIADVECPELDLNGIWRGISRNLRKDLSVQERRKLGQAQRLGFGSDCARLLSRYKHISFHKAAAILTEIEREEAGTGHDSETRNNVTTQNLDL